MNALVAVASKHGSTHDIADAIAAELRTLGLTADVRDITGNLSVEGYDAVIIGSAIYIGGWLPEARRFVERNQAQLRQRLVWLFSSGPLGQDDPQPSGDPTQIDALMEATSAREHRIFVGKLDNQQLGLRERLAVKLVKAPEGDFRDWAAIAAWARMIGATLHSGVARAGVPTQPAAQK